MGARLGLGVGIHFAGGAASDPGVRLLAKSVQWSVEGGGYVNASGSTTRGSAWAAGGRGMGIGVWMAVRNAGTASGGCHGSLEVNGLVGLGC